MERDFLKQFESLTSINKDVLGGNCWFKHTWTKLEKINEYDQERCCIKCGKVQFVNYNPRPKICKHVWKERDFGTIVQGKDTIGKYYSFFCVECGCNKQDTIYVPTRGKNISVITDSTS
jgi:hypothetical protein